MKKAILFCFALLTSVILSGQNLSVGQMLTLSEKSLGEVEEKLSDLAWHFYQATDETEKAYGSAKFVFAIPDFKPGVSIGKYFITYHYSETQSAMALSIMFQEKELYNSYVAQLENLKFKLESSKPENGNIVKLYKNRPYYVKVTIPPNLEGNNSYKFLFVENSSFKKLQL